MQPSSPKNSSLLHSQMIGSSNFESWENEGGPEFKNEKKFSEGLKFDEQKPRYDLLPPHALDKVVEAYSFGATKYEDWNWSLGMKWLRIFGAMMRHAWAWRRGEKVTSDGLHPLASVAWCAMTLMEYEMFGLGEDNRPKYDKSN